MSRQQNLHIAMISQEESILFQGYRLDTGELIEGLIEITQAPNIAYINGIEAIPVFHSFATLN